MNPRLNFKFLPVGGIVDCYISASFVRIFFVCLAIITLLYVTVDFFEKISALLSAGTPIWSMTRYFFYKAPLLISRIVGFATLFSTLFCLGMLARTHEITALRASGISVQRLALPLWLLALLICGMTFVWNESLVPIFVHNAQVIYRTEIKNKQQQSLFGTRDIWIRGDASFVNVANFDVRTSALENVTVFLLNRDFSLRKLIEIPKAQWSQDRWQSEQAIEWNLSKDGNLSREISTADLPITETPADLRLLARDAEEYTFFDLQKQIADMKNKGLDSTVYEVDLQSKLAFPFISPLMVFLAIPFAIKQKMSGSVSLSFGLAMLIGFGYWVLSAFCISLGHTGALTPWIAAWLPNGIFSMIGLFFYTAEE